MRSQSDCSSGRNIKWDKRLAKNQLAASPDTLWCNLHSGESSEARGGPLFPSFTFSAVNRFTEEDRLANRQLTGASDRAIDSRIVMVRANDGFQNFGS